MITELALLAAVGKTALAVFGGGTILKAGTSMIGAAYNINKTKEINSDPNKSPEQKTLEISKSHIITAGTTSSVASVASKLVEKGGTVIW